MSTPDELWAQVLEKMGAGKTLSEAEKQQILERPFDAYAWVQEELLKMYGEELKKEFQTILGVKTEDSQQAATERDPGTDISQEG